MQGLGYTHPEWGHGNNHGSLKIAFDLIDLDQAELELRNGLIPNLHIQTLAEVEIKNSKKTDFGQGVIEQLFIGPHRPSGFKGLLDGITE